MKITCNPQAAAIATALACAALMISVAPRATLLAQQAASPAPSASLTPPPDAPPVHPVPRGPLAVTVEANPSLTTHTIYRPTDLSRFGAGEKLPIIAWGNGACSNAGLLFANFLTQIASHGYLAIASGPHDAPLPAWSAVNGTEGPRPDLTKGVLSGRTADQDLLKAIDWAIAENGRQGSPYFGKLDPGKVAVMGQSCGGLQATAVAGDPRVKTVVIWNSGVFNTPQMTPAGGTTNQLSGATKESLKAFHTPVAYFLGGPSDIAYANGKDDFSRVTVPAFFGSIHSGHAGTYGHAGGGWFGEVGVAWLDWQLKGRQDASRYFTGRDCLLCRNPVWEVERKKM